MFLRTITCSTGTTYSRRPGIVILPPVVAAIVVFILFLLLPSVVRQQTILLEVPVLVVTAFPVNPTSSRITNIHIRIHIPRGIDIRPPWQHHRASMSSTHHGAPNDDINHSHSSQEESQSPSKLPPPLPPVYGLYEVQEEMLIQRGMYEEQLMSHTKSTPLLHIEPPPPTIQSSSSKSQQRNNPMATKGFGSTTTTYKSKSTTVANRNANANANANRNAAAQHYASLLRQDGLVRIDNIIPDDIIDEMKAFVLTLRQEAIMEIQQQQTQLVGESRFADVLLRQNRCDLKLPIGYKNDTIMTPVVPALYHALCQSPVAATMTQVFQSPVDVDVDVDTTKSSKKSMVRSDQQQRSGGGGGKGDIPDAVLYELSCLISDYGSHRQVVHPDNPFRVSSTPNSNSNSTNDPTASTTIPTLLTCFIALQDIVNEEMGPTIFLPNTHTQYAHEQFAQDVIPTTMTTINGTTTDPLLSPKDLLLRNSPSVLGTLTKGYVPFASNNTQLYTHMTPYLI